MSPRYPRCFQTLGSRTTLFQSLFLAFTITENGINWVLILKILILMQCSVKTF